MITKYEKRDGKITFVVNTDLLDVKSDSMVLVDVLYCGICGTDYQKYIGMENVEEWGHEIIGKISNGEYSGKIVTIRTTYPCGCCDNCKDGYIEKCKNWKRLNMNGFSNKIFVNKNSIINIEEEKVDVVYSLIEPLYVANSLIKHVIPIPNAIYTVVGNGTIGLLTAFLLKEKYGAEVRIVGRRNPYNRNKFIEQIGAKYYDFKELQDALNGSDKIIITTPYITIPNILNLADEYSNITFNGISKETSVKIEMDRWHFKNLNIWPSFPHPQSDFSEELQIVKNNKELLRCIITNIYSFDNIEEAFELLNDKTNDCIKVLIKCKEEKV